MLAPQLFNTGEDDIELAFWDFDARHPEVFEAFARIALRRLDAGATYLSAKWIFEVLRTDPSIVRDKKDVVKINNNFSSLFARKFEARYPEATGLFRTRRRRSAA